MAEKKDSVRDDIKKAIESDLEPVTVSRDPRDYLLPIGGAVLGGALGRRAFRKTWGKHAKAHPGVKATMSGASAMLGYIGGSGVNTAVTGRDTLPGYRRKK